MKEQDPNEIVDPSKRASHVLDSVLKKREVSEDEIVIVDESLKDLEAGKEVAAEPERVAVGSETERFIDSGPRERLRVLMVSDDASLWSLGSRAQLRVQSYAALFAEVHIIVLTDARANFSPIRLAENVWAYPTNSSSMIWSPYDAYRIAKKQLLFSDGFRADVITAENPFGAGIAAYIIARKFARALEIQLSRDPFDPVFRYIDATYRWHRRFARFLLARAHSIRVPYEYLREALIRHSKELADRIEVLPPFHDVSVWKDVTPQFDLHERYPLLKFIVLGVASFTREGEAERLISACVPTLLKYPTVGLVIVGDGPTKASVEAVIAQDGLANQIIIEPEGELFSHVKTANVLLDTSVREHDRQILFEAAAAGLPVIMSNVGTAGQFFEDGKNAFVCPPEDTECFSRKLEEFLSNNQWRMVFAEDAQNKVFKFIDLNMYRYLSSLSESLARCVVRFAQASGEESNTPTS